MHKTFVMHDINIDEIAAMERWYWARHSPEISRRFGAFLLRHESFLPVPAPQDAQEMGMYNWRVTETIWREVPKSGPQGNLAFTLPPEWPTVATFQVPVQPDNDFCGQDIQPDEHNVLRWFVVFRYPNGVSLDEGDDWFLNVFAPQMVKREGLNRFFSSKVIEKGMNPPGYWPSHGQPPRKHAARGWDRMFEMWFDNFSGWRNAILESPALTPPGWAVTNAFPFVELKQDFVSSFILERPNDEWLRDSRFYL